MDGATITGAVKQTYTNSKAKLNIHGENLAFAEDD